MRQKLEKHTIIKKSMVEQIPKDETINIVGSLLSKNSYWYKGEELVCYL